MKDLAREADSPRLTWLHIKATNHGQALSRDQKSTSNTCLWSARI